jgi:hypothetical protein
MTDAHAVAAPVLAGRRVLLLDRARMYVCGITPYDVTHLGHAATFVWVDALGQVLRLLGVEPEVCRNVTDVDDVLDAAASRPSSSTTSSTTWPRSTCGPSGTNRGRTGTSSTSSGWRRAC